MTRTTISQADLATHTQEVVDRVQHGEVAFVEQSGRDQAVLLDPLDFRLLQALARCAVVEMEHEQPQGDPDTAALQAYLADEISLGKAADLLGISETSGEKPGNSCFLSGRSEIFHDAAAAAESAARVTWR